MKTPDLFPTNPGATSAPLDLRPALRALSGATAISVWQPWPWCIFHGGKDVENRTWRTNYRGPLLIHASRHFQRDEYLTNVHILRQLLQVEAPDAEQLHFGCIIGWVDLVDCRRFHPSRWAMPDCIHWVLSNPRLLPHPIPYRASQGLFSIKPT